MSFELQPMSLHSGPRFFLCDSHSPPCSLYSPTDLLSGSRNHQTHVSQGLYICFSMFFGKCSPQAFFRQICPHHSRLCSTSPVHKNFSHIPSCAALHSSVTFQEMFCYEMYHTHTKECIYNGHMVF